MHRFLALFLAFWPAYLQAQPSTKLIVYPEKIVLDGPRADQQIVVLGESADGSQTDLTRQARFECPEDSAAQVSEGGRVQPIRDGNTQLKVTAGGQTRDIPIQVIRSQADQLVNFSTEVQPVLTKFACNSGGCHGAALGRGGFRLSLFGFDHKFDHEQIVHSNEGRRVVVSDPEKSILLAKPALVMEHGGGERLKLNSKPYTVLQQWLADGAPPPGSQEATVVELVVFPAHRVMKPQEQQQLAVTAVWSDGRREDVTGLTQFDAINDGVATVTSTGMVTSQAAGETHVMVRFGGQVGLAGLSSPYRQLAKYPELPKHNFIDEKLVAKWKELGLVPSPLASDEVFLRRLYLDAIGTLPTAAEIKTFLANSSPDKRNLAIETVLNRPEFVDWWTLKWGDLLRIDRTALQEKGMWSFANWVRAQLRDEVSVDEFVREIITAEGSTFTEGPANFYRVGRNAEDWAETATQVFLGIRVQCAKCHTHPFEKWTQADYYSMTAFFSRLSTKNSTEFGLFGRESVIFLKPTGEARHPKTGQILKPRAFDSPEMEDEFDRRQKLAVWMTQPNNLLFTRNIVNRFWGYLMGRGLVEPLDDMRATNPASNPELLDALAIDFAQNGFQLKHLLRTIFQSRAYQLSSQVVDGNQSDGANTHFTRFTVKQLTAEQLADALDFATGTREKYAGVPLGTRAIQLPDTQYRSYFLDTFGRPARQIACECERSSKPNIAQAFHLLNGDFLNKKIADKSGRLEQLITAKKPMEEIINELYLAALCREANANELAKAQGWIKSAPNTREGLQDLLWVLINSKEFLFVH